MNNRMDTPLFDAMCNAYGIIGDRPQARAVRQLEIDLTKLQRKCELTDAIVNKILIEALEVAMSTDRFQGNDDN